MTDNKDKPIEYITYNGVQGKAVEGVKTQDGGAVFDLGDMADAVNCSTCKSIGYKDSLNDPDKCEFCDNPAYDTLQIVSTSADSYFKEMMELRETVEALTQQVKDKGLDEGALKIVDDWVTIKEERDALRELVVCLLENEPDDHISDGGHTVLDLWRHDARKLLGDDDDQ